MSEVITNSSIKLFGMTIVVSEQRQSSSTTSDSSSVSKDISREAFTETIDKDNSSTNSTEETSTEAATSSSVIEAKSNEQEEMIESGTTLVDKPADKILVPCPRCISKDTKFCYYNNNNHNQPRHFCKNCQRYWTNGGVMRNLPVGSGRRKTKSTVTIPNYPHASSDAVNGIHSEQNGFFIYGSDESKASKNSSHVYGSSSGIPVVFYPTTPYWGTCSLSPPPMPLVSRTCSTLGKRVREEMIVSPSTSEIDNPVEETNAKRSSVLVPKTLRFDVPNEAARSSIWSALGIKNDNETSLSNGFEGKCARNSSIDIAKMLLQANPAALHRSLNFQESI